MLNEDGEEEEIAATAVEYSELLLVQASPLFPRISLAQNILRSYVMCGCATGFAFDSTITDYN